MAMYVYHFAVIVIGVIVTGTITNSLIVIFSVRMYVHMCLLCVLLLLLCVCIHYICKSLTVVVPAHPPNSRPPPTPFHAGV